MGARVVAVLRAVVLRGVVEAFFVGVVLRVVVFRVVIEAFLVAVLVRVVVATALLVLLERRLVAVVAVGLAVKMALVVRYSPDEESTSSPRLNKRLWNVATIKGKDAKG